MVKNSWKKRATGSPGAERKRLTSHFSCNLLAECLWNTKSFPHCWGWRERRVRGGGSLSYPFQKWGRLHQGFDDISLLRWESGIVWHHLGVIEMSFQIRKSRNVPYYLGSKDFFFSTVYGNPRLFTAKFDLSIAIIVSLDWHEHAGKRETGEGGMLTVFSDACLHCLVTNAIRRKQNWCHSLKLVCH
jgi:hypothetical protein